jgi:hypothetical protein
MVFIQNHCVSGFCAFRNFQYLENTTFWKLDLLPYLLEGRETSTLLGLSESANSILLSRGPNRVGVSFPSPEYGKRPSFGNIVFSTYLEFRMMD